MSEITRILTAAQQGDQSAAELLPLVYEELRRLAASKMAREVPGQTLQPTALVHEAWLRLSQNSRAQWQNREQFYAIAAETMRRILVDRARHDGRVKRGRDIPHVSLDDAEPASLSIDPVDVFALDRALSRLEGLDPQQGPRHAGHPGRLRVGVWAQGRDRSSGS